MVDFEKHSMMDALANKKASCWTVITIDLRTHQPSSPNWLRVRGVFDIHADAIKACNWLAEKEKDDYLHHQVRAGTITKWRGPDA